MPAKKSSTGAMKYCYCSEIKIIICDGDQRAVVTAFRYLCEENDGDMIVYQHPSGNNWGPYINVTNVGGPREEAVCSNIDQPANSRPDALVESRISDKLNPPYGSKIYTCEHTPEHLGPLEVANCRAALGYQLCTQLPLPHHGKGGGTAKGKKAPKKAAAKAARKAEKKSQKKK